jgi:hypothetical protein
MAERHGRILSELAELALSLARDLRKRTVAADTPEAVADLGLAFQRIARSVGQTVALEAKLERDRDRVAREDRVETVRRAQAVAGLRKAQVRAAADGADRGVPATRSVHRQSSD